MRFSLESCIAAVVALTAVGIGTAKGQSKGDDELREAVEAGMSVSYTFAGDPVRFLPYSELLA